MRHITVTTVSPPVITITTTFPQRLPPYFLFRFSFLIYLFIYFWRVHAQLLVARVPPPSSFMAACLSRRGSFFCVPLHMWVDSVTAQ